MRSDRLREAREKLGWSQQELNRRCGFGAHQVHRYESEKGTPSTDHLKMLATRLGVTSDYLLGLSNDPGGNLDDCDLNEEERDMLDVFRREGWRGVVHLGVDRIAK